MFLWRSLPPAAIVACFRAMVSRAQKRQEVLTPKAEDKRAPAATAQVKRLDRATAEIQSQV